MADFLSRLAARTLGLVPVVQPAIAPLFAPQQPMGSDYLSDEHRDGLMVPAEHRELSIDPPRIHRRAVPSTTHHYKPDELGEDGQRLLPTAVSVSHLTDVSVVVEEEIDRDNQVVHADGTIEHRMMPPEEMTMEVPPQRVALRQQVMKPQSVLPVQAASGMAGRVETDIAPVQASREYDREEAPLASLDHAQPSLVNMGRLPERSSGEESHLAPAPVQARQFMTMTPTTTPPIRPLLVQASTTPAQPQGGMQPPALWRGEVSGARARQISEPQQPSEHVTAAPTINVSIGRIEVRATPPPPQDRKPRSAAQTMSLQEYLRERDDRGRR